MTIFNRNILGAGAVCLLLSSASCGSGEKKGDAAAPAAPVVEFESYRYDAIAQVADSDTLATEGGKYWRFSGYGMLPVRIADRDISELRDSLQRLGGAILTDTAHAVPAIDSGLTLTDLKPASTDACSSTANQLSISLVTPDVIVWKDYAYSYLCMAAHGTYNTTFVNYSVADGKILSVADLMKKGYESKLESLIRKKLSDNKVSLLVPLDEVGIPKDFEITTQGIRFVYGLYEIAPYVEGEVTVEFDAYELEDLFADGVNQRYFLKF